MRGLGSHFLGKALRERGHEVRLMPAQYVKPFVKTNKSDFIDAEAIAEAVSRPSMRFVPIKTDEQLDMQSPSSLAQDLLFPASSRRSPAGPRSQKTRETGEGAFAAHAVTASRAATRFTVSTVMSSSCPNNCAVRAIVSAGCPLMLFVRSKPYN